MGESVVFWGILLIASGILEWLLGRGQLSLVLQREDLQPETDPCQQWWTITAIIIGFIAGLGISALAFFACRVINQTWASHESTGHYVLLPEQSVFLCYALFLGLFTGHAAALAGMKRILTPQHYKAWLKRRNLFYGYRSDRLVGFLGVMILVPATVYLIPVLLCHTVIGEKSITYRSYGHLTSRSRGYEQVADLVQVEGVIAPSGAFRVRPYLLLSFKDGSRWSSEDGLRVDSKLPTGLLEYLERRTGRRARQVRTQP